MSTAGKKKIVVCLRCRCVCMLLVECVLRFRRLLFTHTHFLLVCVCVVLVVVSSCKLEEGEFFCLISYYSPDRSSTPCTGGGCVACCVGITCHVSSHKKNHTTDIYIDNNSTLKKSVKKSDNLFLGTLTTAHP